MRLRYIWRYGSGVFRVRLGKKYNKLKGLPENPNTASKEVGEAARQGDKDAKDLLYQAGYGLGG